MLGAPEINQEAQGDSPVEVLVRVRPLSASEENGVSVTSDSVLLSADSGSKETRSFFFDRVASPSTTQADMFDIIGKRFTDSCLNGYNGSLFAYGQTGSGKTYTMRGPLGGPEQHGEEVAESGLIPRTFQYLFERIQAEQKGSLRFSVSFSYMQIYGKVMTDLLNPNTKPASLHVRQNGDDFHVVNLKWEPVLTANECMGLFRKGLQHLKVGDTSMNKQSSRSHSILTIKVNRRTEDGERCSYLKLIDLAGSERQKDTNAGGQRLEEACDINQSLSALSNVIRALADGHTEHLRYRDNKLTQLLKDVLSGKSKTGIVCNISPASGNLRETLSTLKWAQRAKLIKTQPAVNDEINRGVDQRDLTEIQELKTKLARVQEQNTESAMIQAVKTDSTLSLLERVFSDIVVAEESARLADETMKRLATELDLGVRKAFLKLKALEVAEQRLKERDELIRFRDNERELMEQQHQAQVQGLKTRIEVMTAELNRLLNSKRRSYSHLHGGVEQADPKGSAYDDRPIYTTVPPPLYEIGSGVKVLRSDGVWHAGTVEKGRVQEERSEFLICFADGRYTWSQLPAHNVRKADDTAHTVSCDTSTASSTSSHSPQSNGAGLRKKRQRTGNDPAGALATLTRSQESESKFKIGDKVKAKHMSGPYFDATVIGFDQTHQTGVLRYKIEWEDGDEADRIPKSEGHLKLVSRGDGFGKGARASDSAKEVKVGGVKMRRLFHTKIDENSAEILNADSDSTVIGASVRVLGSSAGVSTERVGELHLQRAEATGLDSSSMDCRGKRRGAFVDHYHAVRCRDVDFIVVE